MKHTPGKMKKFIIIVILLLSQKNVEGFTRKEMQQFWEEPLPAKARIHDKSCPVCWGLSQWVPKKYDKELWGNKGVFKKGIQQAIAKAEEEK